MHKKSIPLKELSVKVVREAERNGNGHEISAANAKLLAGGRSVLAQSTSRAKDARGAARKVLKEMKGDEVNVSPVVIADRVDTSEKFVKFYKEGQIAHNQETNQIYAHLKRAVSKKGEGDVEGRAVVALRKPSEWWTRVEVLVREVEIVPAEKAKQEGGESAVAHSVPRVVGEVMTEAPLS